MGKFNMHPRCDVVQVVVADYPLACQRFKKPIGWKGPLAHSMKFFFETCIPQVVSRDTLCEARRRDRVPYNPSCVLTCVCECLIPAFYHSSLHAPSSTEG